MDKNLKAKKTKMLKYFKEQQMSNEELLRRILENISIEQSVEVLKKIGKATGIYFN